MTAKVNYEIADGSKRTSRQADTESTKRSGVGAVGWTQKYAKVTTFADFCWLAALADEITGRCTKVTNFL